MALAVIGGLIFSTVLSLIFVPAMFAMMDDFSALCWRIGKRFITSGTRLAMGQDHVQPGRRQPNSGDRSSKFR